RGANVEYARAVATDGNVFLVVWVDNRNVGATGLDVLGMRIAKDGTELDARPFTLCHAAGDQIQPAAAALSGGDFLVVWADGRDGLPTEIWGARVPASGVPRDPDGFFVALATNTGEYPVM